MNEKIADMAVRGLLQRIRRSVASCGNPAEHPRSRQDTLLRVVEDQFSAIQDGQAITWTERPTTAK